MTCLHQIIFGFLLRKKTTWHFNVVIKICIDAFKYVNKTIRQRGKDDETANVEKEYLFSMKNIPLELNLIYD